jgi:hypothetical protein
MKMFFRELDPSNTGVISCEQLYLPLMLFLSNRRRQLMLQALTSNSEVDRHKGLRMLEVFSTDFKLTPEPRELHEKKPPSHFSKLH